MKYLCILCYALLPLLSEAAITYRLEYFENFNGTKLNPNVWQRIDKGSADWCKHMSLRSDLVTVNGGQLHAYGKRNEDREADPRPFLTGGVKTEGKIALQYGKIEIRCKLEGQQGAWPAIWMLPDTPNRRWPRDGEIDILERLNFDSFVYQTVHSDWTQKHPNNPPKSKQAPINPKEWNVYGLEWTPDTITWTVNGKPTHSYSKINDAPEQFPWDRPFYLLIDMQLGGNWVGAVKEETLPTAMHIDWVKFYSALDTGKPIGECLFNGKPKRRQRPKSTSPRPTPKTKTPR